MRYERGDKKIWQTPWGYPESFVFVVGLLFTGLLLQICVGSFNFFLLASPVNYFLCGVLALLSLIVGLRARLSSMARWIVGVPLSVALLSALLGLTIIMGIVSQMTHSHTLLGFDSMTSNWAFVMLYGFVLVVLGALIVHRARRFRFCDLSFYLNHFGLYLFLLCSGLGYSDMERYIMYVNEGETQWCVYDNDRNVKELPIAISLDDFSVEFYPSREIYFDVHTGEIQKGHPSQYEGREQYRKVMSEPEPRRFSSRVEVYTQEGDYACATIEVNKPLTIGSWTIYQYGYDNLAGNLSSYSSFELVYDCWLLPVYIGILMMMLGGVLMILTGRKTVKGLRL